VVIATAAALGVAWFAHLLPRWPCSSWAPALVLLALPAESGALRRKLISDGILTAFRRILPPMSQTEREAIEAGTVWWDGGPVLRAPGLEQVARGTATQAHGDEQRFVDHEMRRRLCVWSATGKTTHVHRDLPPHVWQFHQGPRVPRHDHPQGIRRACFSAFAHSEVVAKLASRSSAVVVTVMVPNSLGPGNC